MFSPTEQQKLTLQIRDIADYNSFNLILYHYKTEMVYSLLNAKVRCDKSLWRTGESRLQAERKEKGNYFLHYLNSVAALFSDALSLQSVAKRKCEQISVPWGCYSFNGSPVPPVPGELMATTPGFLLGVSLGLYPGVMEKLKVLIVDLAISQADSVLRSSYLKQAGKHKSFHTKKN